MSRCTLCNDELCDKCYGHMNYGVDCLNATMNPGVDYCEGHDDDPTPTTELRVKFTKEYKQRALAVFTKDGEPIAHGWEARKLWDELIEPLIRQCEVEAKAQGGKLELLGILSANMNNGDTVKTNASIVRTQTVNERLLDIEAQLTQPDKGA